MQLPPLGTPTGPMTRIGGGHANRTYRLDTDRGSFAVKELNLDDRRWDYPVADVFRLEQTAFAAGIEMPEPISAEGGVLVHRWADGDPVPEEPVPASFGQRVGRVLARLHKLGIDWPHPPVDDTVVADWPELADRAVATGQPWAAELRSRVTVLLEITDLVNSCHRRGPLVLTHRDVQPWNLLSRDGRPVLLDWELSGLLDLSGELGSTALALSKGRGLDTVQPAIFRAVLDGYVAAGGTVPPAGPSWFAYAIGSWLGHTRSNVLRCLTGVEQRTGPELALSHQIVDDGLRGLPVMFDRLPELESLLR